MRRALSLVVWFAFLFGFWELLVGTFQLTELLAGLGAAAVASLFAELLRSLGLLRFSVAPRTWLSVVGLAWQLPLELCILAGVLVSSLARGRRVRGEWITVPFDGDAGRRAVGTIVGTATPNAIVVDIAGGEALLHSIRPSLPGGREVL